jgi:signal transduction histidine kinase
VKLPRPHLRWPLRRRPEEAAPAEVAATEVTGADQAADLTDRTAQPAAMAPAKPMPNEDARLLRRTRLRLMAVSALVTLVILVVLEGTVYVAADRLFTNDSVGRLQSYAGVLEPILSGEPPQASPHELDLEYGTRYAGLLAFGYDADGARFLRTRNLPPRVLPVQAGFDAVAKGGSDLREVTVANVPLRVYTVAYTGASGDTYYIQTAVDRTDEVNLLGMLRLLLVGGSLLALLAALVAGYLYAGRALVPIRDSITRRQAALQRQREFTANASHELRAPLTVIRASVEDLRRNRRKPVAEVGAALDDIDVEAGSLTALVEDMLFLARTDSGVVQLDRVPFDLADEAAEAASRLSALGTERHVAVTLDLQPAQVVGDPVRIRQLVTILVDNAVRHSPAGRGVEVRVMPDGGGALLQVVDNGPGVKPEDLPCLWERFWRADDAPAGGTGLGLAIAKWIVEEHGGTIGAENRPEGGASFWARLPDVRTGEKATEAETASPKEARGTAEARASASEQPSAPAS